MATYKMKESVGSIIGKIVIESARYADLVAASATVNKKDLLNLIMGKSEVAKAEILNVVTSDAATDTKISLINAQLSEAVEYFKSEGVEVKWTRSSSETDADWTPSIISSDTYTITIKTTDVPNTAQISCYIEPTELQIENIEKNFND